MPSSERSSSHKVPSFGRRGDDFRRKMVEDAAVQRGAGSFSLRWISQQNRSVISDVIKNICTLSCLAWSVDFFFFFCYASTAWSLSPFCSRHSQGGIGATVEKGEKGDPVRVFAPPWHLPHCCMTVINRGALPQGQPAAAGTIGVKGQKVSGIGGRRSAQSLFVLHRVCSWGKQREGQVEDCSDFASPSLM